MFTIATRSKNNHLTKKVQGFFNLIAKEKISINYNNIIKIKNKCTFQKITEALFLKKLFSLNGWVIHVDEDAFCWNLNEILKIKKYMEDNNFHVCGCIDENVLLNGNPVSINPFFMIINMDKIDKIGFMEVPDECYKAKLQSYNCTIDKCDAHYSFFWFLKNNGVNFLHLDMQWLDLGFRINPSIVYGIDNPFLIHAWEARGYYKNDIIKKKVDYCYQYAKEKYVPYSINANKKM